MLVPPEKMKKRVQFDVRAEYKKLLVEQFRSDPMAEPVFVKDDLTKWYDRQIDIMRELTDPPEPPRLEPWPRHDGAIPGDCVWHEIQMRFNLRLLSGNAPLDWAPNANIKFERCQTVLPDDPRRYPHWHHLPCPCGQVVWKLN